MKTAAHQRTEEIWRVRVAQWKESGQTAADFVRGRGFSVASLHNWSSRFGAETTQGFVRVVPQASVAPPPPSSELVIEVGGARLRITRGFDQELLASVLRLLSGGTL